MRGGCDWKLVDLKKNFEKWFVEIFLLKELLFSLKMVRKV